MYVLYEPNLLIFFIILSFFTKYALIFIIFLLYFFRGYDTITTNNNFILSPCQGKIQTIIENENTYHIKIFLNIFDIHIQMIPIDCTITNIIHKPGNFNPAYFLQYSDNNERMEYYLNTKFGEIIIYQIAGMIARSCVSLVNKNDIKKQGDPLGLIKFSSRVDIIIPKKLKLNIKENQYIKIGDVVASY